MRLTRGIRINPAGLGKNSTRSCRFKIGNNMPRHFLKHPTNYEHVKVNMLVQTGAEAVDESDCANVYTRLVRICRISAAGLQSLRDDPQNNPQHRIQRYTARRMKYRSRLCTDSNQCRTWRHRKI